MRKKHKIKRKRNSMRSYPHAKTKGRLLRNGWQIEVVQGTMKIGEENIPVETEVFSHPELGQKLPLEQANLAQRSHEKQLLESFVERASAYLEENGWTLRPSGQWYKPNWNPAHEAKQQERLKDTGVEPGYYASLNNAYRMQLKLDSAPEVAGLEESLEDLMLMSHANEFGA